MELAAIGLTRAAKLQREEQAREERRRMNKTKKAVIGVGAALLALLTALTGFLLWRRATWRYPYSPETRKVLSHSMNMSRIALPSIKNNLLVSDAVIYAKIVSDGDILQAGDWDATMAATEYRVKVLETLYGSVEGDTLRLRLPGDKDHLMSKPHQNDEVVLFIIKNSGYYALADMEASIFAIMPDETLYSFEDATAFSQFDGQPYSQLCEEIALNAEEIKADIDTALDTTVRFGIVLQQLAEEAAQAGGQAAARGADPGGATPDE